MPVSKLIPKKTNLFLIASGVFLFTLRLFNRKTRALLIKFLGFGAELMADYTIQKYLPQAAYRQARDVPEYFPLMGSKGGKAVKKRSFRHFFRKTDSIESRPGSRFFSKYPVINSI